MTQAQAMPTFFTPSVDGRGTPTPEFSQRVNSHKPNRQGEIMKTTNEISKSIDNSKTDKKASKMIDIKTLEKSFKSAQLSAIKEGKQTPLFKSLVGLENSYGKVLNSVREYVSQIEKTKQGKPCLASTKKSIAQVLTVMDAYHLYRIAPHGSQSTRHAPNGILQNVKREVQKIFSNDQYAVLIEKPRGKAHAFKMVKSSPVVVGITAKAKGQQIVSVPTDIDTPSAKAKGKTKDNAKAEGLSQVEQAALINELEPVELSNAEKQALVSELVKKVGIKFAMDTLLSMAEQEALAN